MAEKKINGRTFKTQPMLASRALVLQARIIKLVGPGLGDIKGIMAAFGEDKTEEQKQQGAALAIKAISDIFSAGDPEQMVSLVSEILREGMILRPSGSYDPIDLDGDFITNQGDVFSVLFFILMEQFAGFFTGLQGIGSLKIRAKA